jgi:predicted  nucleic acid-binding Zn-ribbon protein
VQKLLALQERDCKIRDLEKEMRDIPLMKQERQTKLNKHKEEIAAAEKSLTEKLSGQKQFEVEVGAVRDKIGKLRQQQLELKTNKEFKAMESEIGVLEDEIAELEDKEMVVMEEIDAARSDIGASKVELAAEEKVVESELRALDERGSGLGAKLSELKAGRDVAANEVEPSWRQRYERVMGRRDKAIVPVEGGICGGCHLKLPPYVIHDTKKEDTMVSCDFCGRLLY